MSADIEKLAVFDGRIVQSRPKYAVEKGALSVTNAPFNAIAATASQHTYNIYVPSENVFVSRKMDWTTTFYLQTIVTCAGAPGAGVKIAEIGKDVATKAFPLNSLVSTLSATINDTTSVINTQDVLDKVLRLADFDHNREVRTTPTALDTYGQNKDGYQAVNNPMAGYNFNVPSGHEYVGNGSFCGVKWCAADGTTTTQPVGAGANQYQLNADAYGSTSVVGVAGAVGPFTLYLKVTVTEPLVISPFCFSEIKEYDTGLFGINNIQLVMNMVSSPALILRTIANLAVGTSNNITSWGAASFLNVNGSPFQNSKLNVQFLTPSLDVPLPPKSVVPYMEFPRYISQSQVCNSLTTTQLVSQTITLPQIPDLLIIWAKPSTDGATAGGLTAISSAQGEFNLPLASSTNSATANPLSVNFDNFSGLLSSHTTEQLYEMSVRNGLKMDYPLWAGQARTGLANRSFGLAGNCVPTVGGPLVLKPGVDIVLQSGQAPSLVGNFTLQFQLSVFNPYSVAVTASLYIITVNSGFFESIRGSSRIIKGVLSEQDIISAPVAPMGTRTSLERMVGGGFGSSFGNILSKAKDIYAATKPLVSAAKATGALGKEGSEVLGHLGYGHSGGGGSGGRRSKKGSLAERLM